MATHHPDLARAPGTNRASPPVPVASGSGVSAYHVIAYHRGRYVDAERLTIPDTPEAFKLETAVIIVPQTGTDQLIGIAGELGIDIRDGKHFYTLDYTLPEELAAKI